MKAKFINEVNQFERGIDPKKAMGTGKHRFKDYEDYVVETCKEYGLNADDFWEQWNGMKASSMDVYDLIEEVQRVVKFAPIDDQISWIAGDLEYWIEEKT